MCLSSLACYGTAVNADGSSSPASLRLNVNVAVVSGPELYCWWNTNELLKGGAV